MGMLSLAAAALLAAGGSAYASTPLVKVSDQGASIEILIPVDEATLEVRPIHQKKLGSPLMGRVEHQAQGTAFVPVAPLIAGQSYRAQWRAASGKLDGVDVLCPELRHAAPQVRLSPEAPLPANALKFYLHFSEVMEQGVFLDRLRLLDGAGKEVLGPFRETELWSPDGKRLTVWFHPGRQKAGVNLNVDEGPVLRPNETYVLVVAGSWRSAHGVALGGDQRFGFSTRAADHTCPDVSRWKLSVPRAGKLEPLQVSFDEELDPAMLHSALRVRKVGAEVVLEGKVETDAMAVKWRFRPVAGWEAGDYEIVVDPLLEDLAGNNLVKPFEVDLEGDAQMSKKPMTRMRFSVGE